MKATLGAASVLAWVFLIAARGFAGSAPSPQKPSVDGQVRDGQTGGDIAPKVVIRRWSSNVFSLIGAEAVQKELVLTEGQKLKLAPLIEEYDMALAELSQPPIPLPGDGPEREERIKAFEERRKKADDLLEDKAPDVLAVLTAEQSTRLSQIMLQKERGNALNERDVQAKLNITREQQRKLRETASAWPSKYIEAMRNSRKARAPGQTRLEALAQQQREDAKNLEKLTAERDAEMMAVLTPMQAEQFQLLRGKEFDVKSLRPIMAPAPSFGAFKR